MSFQSLRNLEKKLSNKVLFWDLSLNNCSLDRFSQESFSYQFASVEIKTSLFVDDISDPNSCKTMATLSNKVLEDIHPSNIRSV